MTLAQRLKQEDKFILFLYVYVFLMPWNFFKSQMGVLTAILLIWWIIRFKGELVSRLKTLLEFQPLVLLIAFIFYTYIAVLWSSPMEDGLKHVNQFSKYYFFLIPILFTSFNREQAINGIKLFMVSFGVYAAFSLMIYAGLFTIESTGSDSNNPKGIMAYAIVSTYMAIGAITGFIIAQQQNNKLLKSVFYLLAILSLFALFVNQGRTAQLSLILTIITIGMFYYYRLQIKHKLLYFVGVISFLAIITFILLETSGQIKKYNEAYAETQEILYENKYEGSFSLRVYFYKVGFEIMQDNLLFGMGPEDNWKELVKIQKSDPVYTRKNYFNSFHSQHMDTLTRYGLVGYILLLASVCLLLFRLKNNPQVFYVALSFMSVVFYTSLANVMLIKKPFNYIFITVFVLLSVIAYLDQKEKQDELSSIK